MYDQEKVKTAKNYIDKLANGIDPFLDKEMPEDALLNDVRLSRIFFFVSEILSQVISSGVTVKPERDAFFFITEEQKSKIPLTEECYISEMVERINQAAEPNNCRKLRQKWLSYWLVSKGFMAVYLDSENKSRKKVTSFGEKIGMKTATKNGIYGSYPVTILNSDAQRYIIENLEAVVSEGEGNQGKPWTAEQENLLRELYSKQNPIIEIAVKLERSHGGVISKLKKLGLL